MLVVPDSAPTVCSPPGSSPRGPGAACPNSPSEERLLTGVPGVGPGQLHRSLAQKNSTLSLVPCCPHLQIFNRFFLSCAGLTNYLFRLVSYIQFLPDRAISPRARGTLLMLLVKGQRSQRSSGLSSQLSFNILAPLVYSFILSLSGNGRAQSCCRKAFLLIWRPFSKVFHEPVVLDEAAELY